MVTGNVKSPVADRTPSDTEARLLEQFARLEQQFAQLREQTRVAQQLASLGAAAAMLAHEFNNLVTPVKSLAQHALDTSDQELMVKALKQTVKKIDVMSAMSDRILGLVRNEARSIQRVNVADVVADAQECLIRDLSKDGIRLKVDIDPTLVVLADGRQLLQVFFNLLMNARKAITTRSGKITISAERLDDETIAIHVADTGCGIASEELDSIFDAFHSVGTDRSGKAGTGLGLALCRDIVEDHRGSITCESEVGAGTKFTVLLPSAD